MSSRGVADSVRTRRQEIAAKRGEPVKSYTRSLVDNNGGLYCNVPELGVELLDLSKGDDLEVEVHDDRVVIRPED